jgi:predicted neuraminidase
VKYDFETISADLLKPPVINTRPGSIYADRWRNYNMVIGADASPGGRVWAAWVSGGDSPDAYFVVASSDDRGQSWSPPRLVIDQPDHPCGLRVSSIVGNFWTDPSGRLWLFFDQSLEQFDGRSGVWAIRCDNPDDAEPVWSAPQYVGFGMSLNKPIALMSGEWVLPVSLWDRSEIKTSVLDLEPAPYTELDQFRMSNVFVSTDQGKSWSRRGGVLMPRPQYDEAILVERRDGTIWMTCRTLDGIYESVSFDAGATWSEPVPSKIANVTSRHFIRRLSSGRLLLVKHGRQIDKAPDGRREISAFLSEDDGHTWQGGLVLERRSQYDCSYPDGFQFADGVIGIVHDYGRAYPSEIIFHRFSEGDVLAGRIVVPGSRIGVIVSRATGPSSRS